MSRYRKLLVWVVAADLMLLAGVLILCNMTDKGKRTGYDRSAGISLVMEDTAGNDLPKEKVFGQDIYERKVVPSGEPMGIYMKTDGVLVVDVCSFRNNNGDICSPSDGILQTGDYIINIDGKDISRRSDMLTLVSKSSGKPLTVKYIRDDKRCLCTIIPEKNENGNYLLGAWVKDDVSGIGTVTFVDGDNFMALGHSVSDIDTGMMMRCSTGGVYTTDITNISKSYTAEPGRLQGSIAYKKALVGIIDGNSASGIYGHLDHSYSDATYGEAEQMYIARGKEVKKDGAYIYSRMSGDLKKYNIDIEFIDADASDKNIEFHVTDDELLELTGGVVQGMSGSPIIQNGRIIGAVTHVFVDDPTRGYGIFIENMLED